MKPRRIGRFEVHGVATLRHIAASRTVLEPVIGILLTIGLLVTVTLK